MAEHEVSEQQALAQIHEIEKSLGFNKPFILPEHKGAALKLARAPQQVYQAGLQNQTESKAS